MLSTTECVFIRSCWVKKVNYINTGILELGKNEVVPGDSACFSLCYAATRNYSPRKNGCTGHPAVREAHERGWWQTKHHWQHAPWGIENKRISYQIPLRANKTNVAFFTEIVEKHEKRILGCSFSFWNWQCLQQQFLQYFYHTQLALKILGRQGTWQELTVISSQEEKRGKKSISVHVKYIQHV